jgi:hypothetical protein
MNFFGKLDNKIERKIESTWDIEYWKRVAKSGQTKR